MSKRLGEIIIIVGCVVDVDVVFKLKTVLTSIQYVLFLTQGKETNFRGHKLTQTERRGKKRKERKSQHLRKICNGFLKITSSDFLLKTLRRK